MKNSEIKKGETYLFVATDSEARKHLEGKPFEVVEIRSVWRRRNRKSRKVKRFFNENGEGARAEELEPLSGHTLGEAGYLTDTEGTINQSPKSGGPLFPDFDPAKHVGDLDSNKPFEVMVRENPCNECEEGEMKHEATIPGGRESTEVWKCDKCGHEERFP